MSALFTPRPTKIDVERYHRMIDAGVFRAEDRIELIEGEMLEMAPINDDHIATVNECNRLCYTSGLHLHAEISVQNPVVLGSLSEPEPDLLLLRPRADHYRKGKAVGSDVLLLIEVSWSSLHFDRTVKMPLYARFGVVESWILNLEERVLEVHRDAGPRGYASRTVLKPGQRIRLQALPEFELDWGVVLG
jgi:Uma2 family endonuclease